MAKRICAIVEEKSGVSYHRLEIPIHNLNENYDLDFMICNGFTLEHLPDYDVIILNRVSRHAETFGYLLQAKENGCKIILDLDDWIELPEWHGKHDGMITPIIEEQIRKTIDIADVVWCASELLRSHVSALYPSKVVLYISNGIDFAQPQFTPNRKKQSRYTIGWIGGASHQNDLLKLAGPLSKLLKQKNYNIMLGGYSKSSKEYWTGIERIFTTNYHLKPEHFMKVNALDCYNYAMMYNLMDCALAPLCDDIYSSCKSNIKVLEAGAFSLPIICSNVGPYKEFIKEGLVFQGGDWAGHIKSLISNPKRGEKIGAALHEYVKENYDINTINKLRIQSIKSL